jgi:carboxylate-amine ligase
MSGPSPLTAADLRAAFDEPAPLTVGLEEELLVLDAEHFGLAPAAQQLVEDAGGDPRFKLEMPAAQVEIVTRPHPSVGAAAHELAAGRRDLEALAHARGLRLAGAGAHPLAAAEGDLRGDDRYREVIGEYGAVARRQLVFGLHVHVAVRGGDRALGVYNALRSYLPELAALAANAPFYEGRDTGLASIRPVISDLLPRQGPPPALGSWEDLARELAWGQAAGSVPSPRRWWWELRLHPHFGTVELRVPDAQSTVGDTAAVAAVAHAVCATLAARHDAGELPAPAAEWRIRENRWSALRHGAEGTMTDLVTGQRSPTRERLAQLLSEVEPAARDLGCAGELAGAAALIDEPGAQRQRAVAAADGVEAVVPWLAERFANPPAG